MLGIQMNLSKFRLCGIKINFGQILILHRKKIFLGK